MQGTRSIVPEKAEWSRAIPFTGRTTAPLSLRGERIFDRQKLFLSFRLEKVLFELSEEHPPQFRGHSATPTFAGEFEHCFLHVAAVAVQLYDWVLAGC